MVWILSRVEANPHRQALHNFDAVAGRVFRRQQTVEFTSRAGQALDVALVIASSGIDVDGHGRTADSSRNAARRGTIKCQREAQVLVSPDGGESGQGGREAWDWLRSPDPLHY